MIGTFHCCTAMVRNIRTLRYAASLCGIVFALLSAGGTAAAAAPEGPRLAFTSWSEPPIPLELFSVDPSGSELRRIAPVAGTKWRGAPIPFGGPTWSPDGSLIAYNGYFRSKAPRILVATADGGAIRAIRGTRMASEPVFSPNGRIIAFSKSQTRGRFFGTTAWIVNIETGSSRRLTPWRDGLHYEPSSFSPDGSMLAMSRGRRGRQHAVALRLNSGEWSVIARNAEAPVYSPDGSRIAMLGFPNGTRLGRKGANSDLYVKSAGSRRPQRITHTFNLWEWKPSWDPSGERLAYVRNTESEILPLGFTSVIMEINRDGTCARKVYGLPSNNGLSGASLYGPAWQPGPGREAGRIAC